MQTVGCCKEYVRVNLKTSKSGYVPGEIIQLEAAIDNQTQGVLNQAWVSLVMVGISICIYVTQINK